MEELQCRGCLGEICRNREKREGGGRGKEGEDWSEESANGSAPLIKVRDRGPGGPCCFSHSLSKAWASQRLAFTLLLWGCPGISAISLPSLQCAPAIVSVSPSPVFTLYEHHWTCKRCLFILSLFLRHVLWSKARGAWHCSTVTRTWSVWCRSRVWGK